MAVEQGAECLSVMADDTDVYITIRKSSTFQSSWNPLFMEDKL